MYLDKAKERFEELNRLKGSTTQPIPCSTEDLQQLENCLGLQLPEAYKEFLLWSGRGGGCFESDHYYSSYVLDGRNREDAIEILERNNYPASSLPGDAIIFIVYHGGYRFSFIRASEGDNPPVHTFQEMLPQPQFVWNDSHSIEEHCLKPIEWCIHRLLNS